MTKEYRTGPVGALMDEYERATDELKNVIKTVSKDDFVKIVDPDTSDPDCRSMQTIMNTLFALSILKLKVKIFYVMGKKQECGNVGMLTASWHLRERM